MPSWTSSESQVISDDDLPSVYYKELFHGMLQKHKQLKKHVNYEQLINVLAMNKSMLEEELRATKSKLKLYDRLFFIMLDSLSVVCVGFGMLIDDDLPSEYYKELFYEMLQKHKQLKKQLNYEQLINVLAMNKSMLEEELRATKSKLKLYDRLFFIMLGSFSVVCVGFGMLIDNYCKCKLQSKCKMQMQLQMLAAKAVNAIACNKANACCSSLQQRKCNCKSCKCNSLQQSKCLLQMLAAVACSKANACCKCLLQMQ
ncbi:hypothetical protein Tco_0528439 [Tanacetum coccineum]